MIRALYSSLMWLAQPFLRRKLARRGQAEPGYRVAVEERFGRYSAEAPQGLVWLHAVSLGETRAAAILLDEWRAREPGLRVLLTHGTATGRAEGERLLRPGDVQAWLPWDTPGAVQRFLRQFRPRLGVLMETEVWPNLVAQCRAHGVPLVLANARLSDKSLRQSLRLAPLSRPAYAGLTAVWAQTQADAQRLRELGAPVQGVFGNLKFDATPDAAQLAQGRAWRAAGGRPVVVFASSREGEEAEFLSVLKQKWPATRVETAQGAIKTIAGEVDARAVQWLIVPRHPQRFDEVAALVQAQGFSLSRRSARADAPAPADVWLGDSLGEMALYYGLAHVALLGGSFAPLGGQNLIEAAACGCPVVMGPHTFNFAEAAALAEAAGAAVRTPDLAQAVDQALALAQGPQQAAATGKAAAFALAHRGAAGQTVAALAALTSPGLR